MSNVQQLIFWTVVVALLTLIFGRFFPNPGQAFFFVSMLLPVIVGTAYFFNYFLVPRYLHSHRHAEFVLYFIYTLIISVYLEMVVLTFAFIYLANYTYENLNPVTSDIFVLVAVLYLIVLLQAFVLEFRRSQQAQIALRALEKEREKQQSGGIVVRVDRRNVPIDFDQILYIESLSDYVRLILDETDSLITKERISHLQQALPASFLRIHRSFIVNLTRVTAYTREYVEIGEDQIPISRTYKKEALAALATYLA